MIRKKDRVLLKELIKDSRLKIVDLSERTGLTRQSVYSKIHNLRENGVNFTIDINPEDLGLNLKAYILIQADPNSKSRKECTDKIKKLKEVSQLHYVLGRFDIVVEVILKDKELWRKLTENSESSWKIGDYNKFKDIEPLANIEIFIDDEYRITRAFYQITERGYQALEILDNNAKKALPDLKKMLIFENPI